MRAAYKVDDLEAASGPGREGRGVERVGLEEHAELSGEVVAPEELVALRHVGQAGHSCMILHIELGLDEGLERVQAVRVRLEEALVHDLLYEDALGTNGYPQRRQRGATSPDAGKERVHLAVDLVVEVVVSAARLVGKHQPVVRRMREGFRHRRGHGLRRRHVHLRDPPRVGRQQQGRHRVGECEGEYGARLVHRWLVERL